MSMAEKNPPSFNIRRGHAWRDEGEPKGLSFSFSAALFSPEQPNGNGLFHDVKKLIIFIGPKLFIAQ